jgi:hypothetical protein
MIEKEAILGYLRQRYKDVNLLEFKRLGAGVHGTGFSLIFESEGKRYEYVIKDLAPQGLGHDYPSDRASVFLLAYDEYPNLPSHVRPVDVLALMEDGSVKSISGGKEYFLVMEKVEGTNYFVDLEDMKEKDSLNSRDREKIHSMVEYLADIHSVKKESKDLYWRKLRDTIGHGECLMGVFDFYPEGVLSYQEMAEIEKLCIDWRAKLKPLYRRLSQIHGDFHPGNIWFRDREFVLLDRSRGPWGEPADDITALSINYIFYSIMYHNEVKDAYKEALKLFYDSYLQKTSDEEILSVVAPFYAFRGAVVAHPVFYPQLSREQRRKIFHFVKGVLRDRSFNYQDVNRYLD